eukprot:IDg8763t1
MVRSVDVDTETLEAILCARKSRFKFKPGANLVLMLEVQLSGAHIAGWGQKAKMYDRVLERFLKSREGSSMDLGRIVLRTVKTLKDRISNLLSERKAFVKKMEIATGDEED